LVFKVLSKPCHGDLRAGDGDDISCMGARFLAIMACLSSATDIPVPIVQG
jgi:hypothetical protein